MLLPDVTVLVASGPASGKVLLAGGFNSTGNLDTTELYDPASGIFTAVTTTMTSARGGHAAVTFADGTVFLSGGVVSPGVVLGSGERYSP